MITAPKDYKAALCQLSNPNSRKIQITKLPVDEKFYKIDLKKRTIEAPEFLSVNHDHSAETIYFIVDRYYDNIDLSTTTCVINFINANQDKKNNSFIYLPPFIDTITYSNKIIIPWLIEGPATKFAGQINFSIQFYRLGKVFNGLTAKEYALQNPSDPYPEYREVGKIEEDTFKNGNKFYYLKDKDFNFYYSKDWNSNNIYYEKKQEEFSGEISYEYIYNLNTIPSKSKILYGMEKRDNENTSENNYPVETLNDILNRINVIEQEIEQKFILYWTIMSD